MGFNKPTHDHKQSLKTTTDQRHGAPERDSMDSVPPPPLARFKIGRYEIIYPIASGGMATVHLGRLSGLAGFERLVAIKVIHPHLVNREMFVNMFLDEARLAAQLHHPNVCETLEVGEDDGLLYMVAELIEGKNLKSFSIRAIRKGRSLSQHLCAYIVAQVCRGLHAAHELRSPENVPLNLVHRDVSPQNIMIAFNGHVKLIDFGVVHAEGRLSVTNIGSVKGKTGFIPPEYIRGEALDRRGDIFAAGVTLYLLVTGSLPFESANEHQCVDKILRGDFPLPSKLNPRIHPELENIILKAMQTDLNKRYQTASQMAYDLDGFASEQENANFTEELEHLMTELFASDFKRHKQKVREHRKHRGETSEMINLAKLEDSAATLKGMHDSRMSQQSSHFAISQAEQRKTGIGDRIIKNKKYVYMGIVAMVLLLLGAFGVFRVFSYQDVQVLSPSSTVVEMEPFGQAIQVHIAPKEKLTTSTMTEPTKNITISLVLSDESTVVLFDGQSIEAGISQFEIPADQLEHELVFYKEGHVSQAKHFIGNMDQTFFIQLVKSKSEKLESKSKKKRKRKARLQKSPY